MRAQSQDVDSLVNPATNSSEGIDNKKLKSPTSDKSFPTTSEESLNNIPGSRSPPYLLKDVSVSKDINELYDYIARVASTCKQLYEEIDTENRSHKEEIDSLKTHMQAIQSRLLVLSHPQKNHKITATTCCKCRDKVSPQPHTERKGKTPKKNDKETNTE